MLHITRNHVVLWGFLLLVLLIATPPFLCMELHSDTILFDIYARNLQKGGVAYRDWCEANLPGMAWLHYSVRSVIGWRSEAIRAVDLAAIAAIIYLLTHWFRDVSLLWRFGLAISLLVFYLGSTEWCHVQRDPWMLLPVLGALFLRRRSLDRPSPIRSVAEGMLLACAFWIKPFAAVPALIVWLASARQVRKERHASVRSIVLDGLAILIGGIVVGAIGIAWLRATGAWPHFVEMATEWNREYFHYDVTEGRTWRMAAGFVSRSFPWILIHFAAAPIAIRDVARGDDSSAALVGALYVGWFGQALLLQHLFDYVYVPAIFLGFVVVLGWAIKLSNRESQRLLAFFLALCVAVRAPILLYDRLGAWPDCWVHGSSPAVRDRVSRLHKIDWRELKGIAIYLSGRGLSDGELTSFNMPTAALFRDLDVEAATRYHFFQNNWLTFRDHRDRIYADLAASRQRFVVVDLRWEGIGLEKPELDLLPWRWEKWKSRIVFQSGRYIVLELSGAETPVWLEECFD